uniref:Uncharacterized protein n=1 Tax=Clytia hemisphaerica TaxID=252671 RepID=A0A7M5WMQ3_9CNID|eukprot:TCONS_00044517-protein
MLTTDIESAVNCAVYDIEKKEMKKEQQSSKNSPFPVRMLRRFQHKKEYNSFQSTEACSSNELTTRLNEGRSSPLVNSEQSNRQKERRTGVSERNETERKLVKQTLKNHIKAEYAKQYNFDLSDMMN